MSFSLVLGSVFLALWGRVLLLRNLPVGHPLAGIIAAVLFSLLSSALLVRFWSRRVHPRYRLPIGVAVLVVLMASPAFMQDFGDWQGFVYELNRWLWVPTLLGGGRELLPRK